MRFRLFLFFPGNKRLAEAAFAQHILPAEGPRRGLGHIIPARGHRHPHIVPPFLVSKWGD